MNVGETLQNTLSRLEGALGVAVIAMDGIVVEERKNDLSIDFQTLGVECSTFLREANQNAVTADPSGILELAVIYEKRPAVMIRKINEECFLLLVLPSDRMLGKGRFQMRRAAAGLLKDFA